MTNYDVHLPTPHEKQKPIIDSKAKRKVIKAGRRGGKTVTGYYIAVTEFLKGRRVLYAAPTQEQIDRFWEGCRRALASTIDAGVFKKNETKHIIELSGTEQRIRAKTAWNADTLRGDYADVLILDEFQLMNEDAWGTVGAPMMLDTNGDAMFIFTPPSFRSRSVTKADDPQHAQKMFKRAKDKDRWETFHFTSHDNPHLSKEALGDITEDMTALAYRQEILAEDVDEVPGALWTRSLIEKSRIPKAELPELTRIIIPIDPQGKKKKFSETGIVPCGIGVDGKGYVLSDDSLNARPEQWGQRAIDCYYSWKADRIVAEANFGGEMVEYVIQSLDSSIQPKMVHASRGKIIRAEPISAMWEKERCHIVGSLPYLEDEMCTYTQDTVDSPNRLDSMVWGMTELMLGKKEPDWSSLQKAGAQRDMEVV